MDFSKNSSRARTTKTTIKMTLTMKDNRLATVQNAGTVFLSSKNGLRVPAGFGDNLVNNDWPEAGWAAGLIGAGCDGGAETAWITCGVDFTGGGTKLPC